MDTNTLQAKKREASGKKVDKLREQGLIPAVVYGADLDESVSITVDRNDFVKTYNSAGESTVVDLEIEDGDTVSVLIQDYQLHPLRGEVTHADFLALDMDEPVETEVKLEFVGTSAAVKALGGTLVRSLDELLIRALPNDLVASIEVDVEPLETFEDVIHVGDIDVPEGVEVLEDPKRSIVSVTPPRTEEELEALEGAVEADVDAVEVMGEEEEELLEGEEAELEEGEEGELEEGEEAAAEGEEDSE
jgi:large subunit ribosomal protein L25